MWAPISRRANAALPRAIVKLQNLRWYRHQQQQQLQQQQKPSSGLQPASRPGPNKGRGRPKVDVIRCKYTKDKDRYWDSEEDDLPFNPKVVVPSDDEDDYDSTSLAAILEEHKDRPVLPILHEWIEQGKETHQGIISAMKRLKWLGRFKQAYEISDWAIKERRLELQKFHFINHLELLGRVVSMAEAEKFWQTAMPGPYAKSEAAFVTMFENYVIHEAMFQVRKLLKKMKGMRLVTTAKLFNKIFLLCEKKNSEDKIPALLREMKLMRISPDVETYTILISFKAKKGDTEGMERLFSKMKCDGDGTPNGTVLCALAYGYVNAGVHEKAMEYLKEVVEDEEFYQSRKMHDKVISLYAAMGKGDMVDRIWRFSRKFPVISADSFLAMVTAYEKVGQIEKAERVFEDLLSQKQRVRSIHFVPMFHAYCEAGEMRKAEKLVQKMAASSLRVNSVSYHSLISGYMKTGNPKMAMETLNKMLNDRIAPCFDTMILLLRHHCKSSDVDSAELLFQDMRRQSYTRNVDAYNTLLQTYVSAGKHAYRFLQRMATDKVAPNANTYLLLNQMKPIPRLCQDVDQGLQIPPVLPG